VLQCGEVCCRVVQCVAVFCSNFMAASRVEFLKDSSLAYLTIAVYLTFAKIYQLNIVDFSTGNIRVSPRVNSIPD